MSYNRHYHKSPFMLGSFAGIIAIVLDFFWSLLEILVHAGIVTEYAVLVYHTVMCILFPICAMIVVYSIVRYTLNGYITKEIHDEKQHRRSKRRKKVV